MFILESPWPILFFGIAVEAILAIALVRTGRGMLLFVMAGVALATLAGLGIERLVVTERERVMQTIDGIAAAVQANDLDAALGFISPSAKDTQDKAREVRDYVEVSHLRVRNLDVSINKLTSPPTAKATFNVIVTGRGKNHYAEFGEGTHVAKVTLQLRLESGRWLITGHEINGDPRDFP
jgi:hypothetical protein